VFSGDLKQVSKLLRTEDVSKKDMHGLWLFSLLSYYVYFANFHAPAWDYNDNILSDLLYSNSLWEFSRHC
jgi:hypothetical protein